MTYRYTYVDAVTELCHVVGGWRTSEGHRFEHVPVRMCSAEVFRGKGAMINWSKKRQKKVCTERLCFGFKPFSWSLPFTSLGQHGIQGVSPAGALTLAFTRHGCILQPASQP